MFDHAPDAVERARQQRKEMSLPGALLRRLLKARPMGVKFRNHRPIQNHVVDFYCHSAKAVFEIDGISHEMGDRPEYDINRDNELKGLGFQIVRVLAHDVLHDPETVAESIVRHCIDISSPSGATY